MHLLETAYQKEYARRRGGGTAVEYIEAVDPIASKHLTSSTAKRVYRLA